MKTKTNRGGTAKAVEPQSTTAMVVTDTAAVINFGSYGVNEGLEGFDAQDLIIPRIGISYGTSEAVKQRLVPIGVLYNSLTNESHGDTVGFIPLKISKGASLFQEGELVCRSDNAIENRAGDLCRNCPHNAYYELRQEKGCNRTIDVLAYVLVDDEAGFPAQITFSKTSHIAGRTLVSLLAMSHKPVFAQKFELGIGQKSGDQGTYDVLKVKPKGFVTQEMFDRTSQFFESFKSKKIVVHDDAETFTQTASAPSPVDDF